MGDKIRILIVDDHPLFRQGVKLYLENKGEIYLAGEAGNGEEALEILEKTGVDVVLLDLQMPRMDGLETLQRIREETPEVRVLILTSFGSWDKVYSALQGGASGYVMKDAPPMELLAAIKTVAAGGVCFGTEVARELLARVDKDKPAPENIEPLTPREKEVLSLMVRGLSNREISEELVVSEKTVKTHVANILQKLGVKSRTQAALLAMREGILGRD